MSRFRLLFTALAVFLSLALPAAAQQVQPGLPLGRLDLITPCGAKAGTTVEILLTGSDLDESSSLLFSHPGIKAEPVMADEPKVVAKDPKTDPPPRKKGPPIGVAAGRFKITVAPNVPVGQYDVRVVHKWGVTNPRFFCVGDLTEVIEKEPNNDVSEAQRVELNSTINGSISAGTDVDFYVFNGKKGQRVVFSCLTSSIDSKARTMVEVFDSAGRRIAFNRNYNSNDALTDAVLPEDGDYFVRVSEFTYTLGGPQYFYRLSISTTPWIDSVFPPMVEPGKPAQVTLYGRNLPGGTPEPGALVDGRPLEKLVVAITPPADPLAAQRLDFHSRIDPRTSGLDGFEYRLKGPAGTSNPVLIAFATAKVVLEKENNDKADTPEEIPAPCEVAGRIDKRQDRDWYAFNAKKGDVFTIELFSDRLGVPADLYFTFKKDKATTEVEEDDNPDIMQNQQFFNRTSDPRPYRFAATEDGRYLIGVGSRESNFSYGPRITYRLRVSPEVPDYRLIVMPSTIYLPDTTVLRADGHQYLDVFVHRNDGFTGAITLTAEGLPPGVTCPPTVLSTGMKQGTLVLTAAANAAEYSGAFTIKGSAVINGKPVVREARPATITWGVQAQQNIPTVARLDQGLYLAVREKSQFKVTLEPEKAFIKKGEKLDLPIYVKPGDKLTIPFKITRSPDLKTPITLQQLSMGIQPQQAPVTVNNGAAMAAIAPDKNDGEIVIDVKAGIAPGSYTVALKATTPTQFASPATKKSTNVTIVTATTPIVLKVLPTSLARVTGTLNGNVKPGMNGQLTIKVDRLFDYTGEFKVKAVLPPNTKGLAIDDVTIPAGKDEVVVPVKVGADAMAGNVAVVLQATALYEGKAPVVQETKVSVTVDKVAKDKK